MREFEWVSSTAGAVVAGVVGSTDDVRVLDWAAEEALIRQRSLKIVHVCEADGSGRESLVAAIAFVARARPDVEISAALLHGAPVAQLLRMSAIADLLALGRSRHGTLGTPLGSLTAAVVIHAHCPTAIVPARQGRAGGDVVVGVSDSTGGMAALRFAFAEAQRRQVAVVAVRSWLAHERQFMATGGGRLRTAEPEIWPTAQRAVLDRCLAQVRGGFPTVPVRVVFTGREPDLALGWEARDAALVVLGCQRADETRDARLASITSWATRHLACPVIVVGHPARLTRHASWPVMCRHPELSSGRGIR